MKRVSGAVVAMLMIVGVAVSANAQSLGVGTTGTQTVKLNNDVGTNQFTWKSDAPLEKIRGTAGGVAGTLKIDPSDVSSIRGTITATVSTMKTGNSVRDRHLQSSDWLDAANYPQIKFTISSIKNASVSGSKVTGTAVGTFTMHGVSKTISVPFTLTYVEESASTRKRASGDLVMIEANFNVSLDDFNVKGKDGLVGSKVGETIAVTAKLYGNTQ